MEETTIIIVPGLFGGIARKHYAPLAKMLGSDEYVMLRAGRDWEPAMMAVAIRHIGGKKKVVCLSCGAMVGNLIANDKDTEVFYICPYLGVEFLNRKKKGYAYAMRHVIKGMATALTVVAKPFSEHRWWPLYGGTKPDDWFLSVYAIGKQLKYCFSEAPPINTVDGAVISYGDDVVEVDEAIKTSANVVGVWTKDKGGPAHCNLRNEGKKFGTRHAAKSKHLSEDAKVYLAAFAEMLGKGSR